MNLREKAVEYPCIECKRPVKKQQEGIFCDGCNQWQHRTCNTRITRTEYRNAVKKGLDINWECNKCLIQVSFKFYL